MSDQFRVLYQIARVHELSRNYLQEELAKAGLADLEPCHGDVFKVLFEKGVLPLSELARLAGRSKSTASVMVGRLEKLGFVQKVKDAEDSRAVAVSLTEKGKSLEATFAQISERLQERITRGLVDQEIEDLQYLLDQLIGNLSK